jgi:hypothetical protein
VSEYQVLAFCAALGFATAGTISSFYQLVTSQRADFSFPGTSFSAAAVTIFINMFAGPFILARTVLAGLRSREIRALTALAAVVIAGMWSSLAGIFYVSLLLNS